MSRAPRAVALAAVLTLPIGAALATYLLTSEPDPPRSPELVRIGQNPSQSRLPESSGRTPTPSRTEGNPTTNGRTHVPPPPPVDDDDDDGADDDGDDG